MSAKGEVGPGLSVRSVPPWDRSSGRSFLTGEENSIDVRIALDVTALTHRGDYDLTLVLRQGEDLYRVRRERSSFLFDGSRAGREA